MKKKLLCLTLVFLLCFSMLGNAYALSNPEPEVEPRGAITLTCGLSTTRASATITTVTTESLSVRFTLYKVVNGNEIYVTAGSNSGEGRSLTASKSVSLTSGTYRMYYSGSGNTQSSGTLIKNYTV